MRRGKGHFPEEILRRLDLNLLVIFDAVLRLNSVSRAAQNLDITQSAVSHALKKLREFFGDPLFVRSGKGIVPTSKAREIGETVTTVIGLLRGPLMTQAVFDPALTARSINLFLNDFGEFVTLPLFSSYVRAVAPNCTIRVVQPQGPELEEALENGSVDLAVSGPAAFSGDIVQQRLYVTSFAVITSLDTRITGPLSLEDYGTMDQVCVRPARPDNLPIDPMLSDSGITRREAISTPHTMAVPAILAANPGMLATVPMLLAEKIGRLGGIRVVPTAFAFPELSVLQFWHRRFQSDSFSMWLRRSMRETMAAAYASGGADLSRLPAAFMNNLHRVHEQDDPAPMVATEYG